MAKVSVIMPVYNKEKYLRQAIVSVLQQTMEDWELIVVDDGSTDGSSRICDAFADPRIRVIHTENGGVSRARNIGLQHARGEYIAFVDGDDAIRSDYLERLSAAGGEIVISGLVMTGNGKQDRVVLPELCATYPMSAVAKRFYQEQMASGIYGFAGGKMLKRSLVEAHHIAFNERLALAEDLDFFVSCYRVASTVSFLHEDGYMYLQGTENSAIALDDKKIDFFEQIRLQKKIKGFLEAHESFGPWEEQAYDRMMAGYVYTILLYSAQDGWPCFCTAWRRLKDGKAVSHGQAGGLQRVICMLYAKDFRFAAYSLLKAKELVRGIR